MRSFCAQSVYAWDLGSWHVSLRWEPAKPLLLQLQHEHTPTSWYVTIYIVTTSSGWLECSHLIRHLIRHLSKWSKMSCPPSSCARRDLCLDPIQPCPVIPRGSTMWTIEIKNVHFHQTNICKQLLWLDPCMSCVSLDARLLKRLECHGQCRQSLGRHRSLAGPATCVCGSKEQNPHSCTTHYYILYIYTRIIYIIYTYNIYL